MITKEGVNVRVGQVWQNLDKRRASQRKTVVDVRGEYAVFRGGDDRVSEVRIDRMHKHSTGWELVNDGPDQAKAYA